MLLTLFSEALRIKDEEAKRELEEAKRDLQSKINDMKNDVRDMGVKYEKEKVEVDRRWQEMLKSSQRERDEAEKRRVAAEQQAQTDRDNQKRQYDSLMDQMKIETRARKNFFVQDFVKILYQNILDRDPESQTVIDFWSRHTYDNGLARTIGGFFMSDEYTAKCMSVEATVDRFYLAVLDRQAEPGGRTYWIGKIRGGMSLRKVADSFVGSNEYRQKVQAGSALHPIYWP